MPRYVAFYSILAHVCLLAGCLGGDGSGGGTDAGSDAGGDGDVGGDGDIAGDGDGDGDVAGDGDGDGDGDAGVVTFDTYCPVLAEAVCQWWMFCRSQPDCLSGPTSIVTGLCEDGPALEQAGTIAFNPSIADACLAAHDLPATPEECAGGPPPFFGRAGGEACVGLLTNTTRVGDACYTDDLFITDGCGEGYCLRADGECPGICVAFATESEACDGSTMRCEADLYCSAAGTCAAYRAEDAACDGAGDVRCATGLYCDGTCVPRATEGSACDDAILCMEDLLCTEVNAGDGDRVCLKQRPLGEPCVGDNGCHYPLRCVDMACSDAPAASGGSCRATENCPAGTNCHNGGIDNSPLSCRPVNAWGTACAYQNECDREGNCTRTADNEPFLCYPRGELDELCDPRSCVDDLWCSGGVCKARSGAGGPCSPNASSCQAGLFCMADNQCHPPGGAGDPCSGYDSETTCQAALFCDRATMTCAQPAGLNMGCHPYDSTTCVDGLYCECGDPCDVDGGVAQPAQQCRTLLAEGDACETNAQCDTGACNGGTCGIPGCRSPAP